MRPNPHHASGSPLPAGSALARYRRRRGRRGIALVMVLGALTILTVMLTEFQDDTSAEFGSALSARDAVKAEYAAVSAINLSRLFIAAEPTIRRSLGPILMMVGRTSQIPVWEFADKVLGAFNDKAGNEAFQALATVKLEEGKNLGLTDAGFDVAIIDEDSKINLNSAARDPMTQMRLAAQLMGLMKGEQFNPLFENRDMDGQYSDRQAICSAMIDWADSNQDLTPCDSQNAAAQSPAPEDAFYQMLDPSYVRKNAPFDSLEELRLVRGIGDDFWSTFVETNDDDPAKRNLTIWGQGQINVNTANANTLWAIICGHAVPGTKVCEDLTKRTEFIALVTMVRMFLKGVPLFNGPKGFVKTLAHKSEIGTILQAVGLDPIQFTSDAEVMKVITTDSKVFSIVATGRVKAGTRETRVRVHSVVDFRDAPPPGAPLPPPGAPPLPSGAGGAPQGAGGAPQGGQGSGLTGLPHPGGRVVYYRVD